MKVEVDVGVEGFVRRWGGKRRGMTRDLRAVIGVEGGVLRVVVR